MPKEVTRHISARIPKSQYEFLKRLQERIGAPFSEALRHTITLAEMIERGDAYLTLTSDFIFGSRFRKVFKE